MKKVVLSGLSVILFYFNSLAQLNSRINVGEPCPDIKLKNIVNFDVSEARISDFKGKLLIIDFWATWCSPCVSFFKVADSLQKQFEGKIQILPVTYQDKQTTVSFLAKYKKHSGITPPTVVSDSILQTIFPHNEIPHEVWIDQNGIVRAITGSEEVNAKNIQALLNGQGLTVKEKRDELSKVPFDLSQPILTVTQMKGFQITNDDLLTHSVLTKYKKELPDAGTLGKEFIGCYNMHIKRLFQLAFGEFKAEFDQEGRVIAEVKDSTIIDYPKSWFSDLAKFRNWQMSHMYCYELNTGNDTIMTQKRFQIMQNDLNSYFGAALGITAKKEKRNIKYLALIKTSGTDKLQSKGGEPDMKMDAFSIKITNMKFINLISNLQAYFYQGSAYPLMDDTNYTGNVDIELNCKLSNMHDLNNALSKYDLKFVEKEREIEMIVISQK